jgi:large-conductance mechanosensitive channel
VQKPRQASSLLAALLHGKEIRPQSSAENARESLSRRCTGKGTLEHTVPLNYGNFIQTVVEFVIIAWSVFLLVKALNQVRRLGEKPHPSPGSASPGGPQK